MEALEVRFLANTETMTICILLLLTDFLDAGEQTMPDDETLLILARCRGSKN